jgi:phage terminase large subunit-like protein
MAGRGFGKTRTGAEWVRDQIEKQGKMRMALVGATAADARDIMVEGESGLLAISPPWFRPIYKPSKRGLIWPNGAIATVYSSEKPDRLRGPSHDGAWADELAAWRNPEAWDMLQMTLRLGKEMAKVCVTTTPKPVPHVKDLLNKNGVVITKGTTYENLLNLSPRFREEVLAKYEGTRLGRQEINAELLEDAPGSLWKRWQIEKHRVKQAPELRRVVIGVDPEATSTEQSAETGIIGCAEGVDGAGYCIGDFTLRGTPAVWGRQVVTAYHRLKANYVVAESNQGGEMVEYVIKSIDKSVPVTLVHASRGKFTRAEPVAALAEQGKLHHVGYFPELEDQQCQWTPGEPSPDRMDAYVWGMTELFVTGVTGGARKLRGL